MAHKHSETCGCSTVARGAEHLIEMEEKHDPFNVHTKVKRHKGGKDALESLLGRHV